MKKYLVLSLLISSLAFTACASGIDTDSQPENTDQSATTDKVQEALDLEIYDNAVNTMDLERCEDISDTDMYRECSDLINAKTIKEDAISQMDESICEDISLDAYKEDCKKQVSLKIEKENSQQIIESTTQAAVDAEDLSLCDDLDDNSVATCRANILINLALKNNDPSYCTEIGDKELESECKLNFE